MRGMHLKFNRQGRNTFHEIKDMADTPTGRGEGPCGMGFGHGHGRHGEGRGMRHGGGFGGGHGGRGNGRGRGRSPLGRLIAHGNLHLLILHLISEQPRHGYETIRLIEEMTGGAYIPSPGTIYPALSMLEDQGFIAPVESDSSKKRFAITEEGTAYLEENHEALETLLANITSAAKHADQEPAPRILEAMETLKTALSQRLCRGPLDDAQTDAVAGVLHAAAREIEGS